MSGRSAIAARYAESAVWLHATVSESWCTARTGKVAATPASLTRRVPPKVTPPSPEARTRIRGDALFPSSHATTTRPLLASVTCTCAGAEVAAVSIGCAAQVAPPSVERAYQTPAAPPFPVHQAMWTAPAASAFIEAPACGHPG